MRFYLKILSSPDKDREGEKFPLKEGDNVVGRKNPPAAIELSGTKVSRKHCVLIVRDNSLRVSDLKSSNGLFVNGRRAESAVLKEKDRLVIGEYVLEVAVG